MRLKAGFYTTVVPSSTRTPDIRAASPRREYIGGVETCAQRMFPRHQYISASAAGASSENIANQPCLNESGSRKICYGEERIWFIPGVYFSGSESCFF